MHQGMTIDINSDIAVQAAKNSLQYRLPMADSIIFTVAKQFDSTLWTQDVEYQTLIQKKITPKNQSAVHWIVDYKPGGTRSKQDIDQQIREERSSWVGE